MATNSSLKNQLIEKEQTTVNVQETMFKNLINSDDVKSKFTEVLKDKAIQYINSIINLVNSDKDLIECEPKSIIDACMSAVSLDLSVDKNLEYVEIIPYKKKANFQLGYRGYIQLLLRTGEYKSVNIIEVYEGQLKSWNQLAEEFDIDFTYKKSDAVIGYAGYFEMLNGFRKSVYWSKENMDALRENSFKSDTRWNNDYKAMAKRAVIRNMISKWGSLSIEMEKAYCEDLNTDKFVNGN
ncbi:recombinase RecT [Clostridium saccharobutylicum]|uniref:Recombination and repair protein RecT n=1 Tax=Clostridium saccharobutylicum TaxID=169679 RepID=A0A1S8MRP8_CLOSA|nr:recombinase RecT [Clostridium saccharobutylicum]OOM06797.1 recombination and repair protein RecT [Clostridium saccharobutylicum]